MPAKTSTETSSRRGARAAAIATRQSRLTKPQGSLGRLEELVAWLGRWQGRETPRLDDVSVLVFAGNHGVVARGVSAYPASVTAQMVANFERGGAAINQICKSVGASLRVIPLKLDAPTGDFTERAGHDRGGVRRGRGGRLRCRAGTAPISSASARWASATPPLPRLLPRRCSAAAASAGPGAAPALTMPGLARKREVIDAGLTRHQTHHADPLAASMIFGGRELAAILGATLAARRHRIPVLLDGFVATAAAAPLARLKPGALDHAQVAHCSAEAGHRGLCAELGMRPILDLDMRLGEGSGAALSVSVLRAALACHLGMATFDEAGVDERD